MTAFTVQLRWSARRCFATARELGLEQGEQHRLLRLAAAHAVKTLEARERSRPAAPATPSAGQAAPPDAAGAKAVSPQAPPTGEEEQQPAAAKGEPAQESTMAGLTSASADSPAAPEGGGVAWPTDAVMDDSLVEPTAATTAADWPQFRTPSTEQGRHYIAVTSAVRTAANDRQMEFMRDVCRRLQAELPVRFSRQRTDVMLLPWQMCLHSSSLVSDAASGHLQDLILVSLQQSLQRSVPALDDRLASITAACAAATQAAVLDAGADAADPEHRAATMTAVLLEGYRTALRLE